MLIGISGKRGTGKTTLGQVLELKYGFEPVGLADSLKEMVKEVFNLTEEHVNGSLKEAPLPQYSGYTPRTIMIDVGQFFRKYDENIWIKKLLDRKPLGKSLVITDVRFWNEANFIKESGGLLVRLNRSADLSIYKGLILDASETALDDYPYFDLVVKEDENVELKDLDIVSRRVYELAKSRVAA